MDFNGFDKGVIGKGMPIDSTLKRIRETELIERALAELGAGATDNSKCSSGLRHCRWHNAIKTQPPCGADVLVCFSGKDENGTYSDYYIECTAVGRYLGGMTNGRMTNGRLTVYLRRRNLRCIDGKRLNKCRQKDKPEGKRRRRK